MPSFDGFHPVDFNTSSGNEIKKPVNSVVPWRPFFIIDGFSRCYWWFPFSTTNQSISLMFDFKIIYSHEMKCIRFDGIEDPGISEDYTNIISPPRL